MDSTHPEKEEGVRQLASVDSEHGTNERSVPIRTSELPSDEEFAKLKPWPSRNLLDPRCFSQIFQWDPRFAQPIATPGSHLFRPREIHQGQLASGEAPRG